MKQVHLVPKNGRVVVAEVPAPQAAPGYVLVRVAASVVSAGTERSAVEFAQRSLLGKARSRPDLVRQFIDKARREGILSTFEAASRRLDQPQSLGYSCAGTVITVGDGVAEFKAGDRVACAGANHAVHAEFVAVPEKLVASVPDGVSLEHASFATLGSIAMHGVRLAQPQVGETVAVIGLGLIGLLTVQIAKAAGCAVVGMEPDPRRCEIARQLGCDAAGTNPEKFQAIVARRTTGNGADAVLIAAATQSNAPVELAAAVARPGATVVSVGAVGTTLPRKPYFDKELKFLISRSYGPGRYDPKYEEKGHDYPVQYVRWTENRNMKSFLGLLAEGKLKLQLLITHSYAIDEAPLAYELITGKTGESFLGVLIRYTVAAELTRTVRLGAPFAGKRGRIGIGLLGAGNFAGGVLIPAFRAAGVNLVTVCTTKGATARHIGEKFGFASCTTEGKRLLDDSSIDAVVIATRHNLHAAQVLSALRAGKHVFCEKPLCLNDSELADIAAQQSDQQGCLLMVGFNRRFAPMVRKMREFFAPLVEPVMIHYRVNGGAIPKDHWIQDPEIGGGRIIGELCHFVDVLQFLTGSLPVRVFARVLPNCGRYCDDNLAVTLEFANGSIGQITYVANGDKSLGKELAEMFGGGRSAVLEDYRSLQLVTNGRASVSRSRLRQRKGHVEECAAFIQALHDGGAPPISFEEIFAATSATFRISESLQTGLPIVVDTPAVLLSRRRSSYSVLPDGAPVHTHKHPVDVVPSIDID